MAVSGVYSTYPKARKEYQCQSCNYPILKGMIYERETVYMTSYVSRKHSVPSCTDVIGREKGNGMD